MSDQFQSNSDGGIALDEETKVFGPSGFATVVRDDEANEKVMVDPIRPESDSIIIHDRDDLDVIDEREWIVYDEGVTETPHR